MPNEEIIKKAGQRTAEEAARLILALKEVLNREKAAGRGKLKGRLPLIKADRVFLDGRICFLPARGRLVIIGDTHGDFEATLSILTQTNFWREETRAKTTWLFLGDYVDRGSRPIANLELVFDLKINFPDRIILLQGNHEEPMTNSYYGFLGDLSDQFGFTVGKKLWQAYNAVFNRLAVVAVVKNGIICLHAGVPKITGDYNFIKLNSEEESHFQMRWNDPEERVSDFGNNWRGPGSYTFGSAPLEKFLNDLGGRVLIRSHEYPHQGFESLFGGKLITIFSNGGPKSLSSAYQHYCDKPKFLEIDLGRPLGKPEGWLREVEYRG